MTKHARFLARALEPLDNLALGDLARALGIPPEVVRRAAHGSHGQPTRAAHFIRLCGYLGVDPATGAQGNAAGELVEFHPPSFGVACRMRRFERKATLRDIAKLAGISATAVSRAEHGDPRSFDTVIALVRALDLDLGNYVIAQVSREALTGNSAEAA